MEAVSCSGHVPPSNQKHWWPLTWAQVRTALVLQRPFSTWETIFTFNVDIKVPEPWRTSGDAQEPELQPEDQREKWWLVSWNSWFHFPAGLGNCPHCSTWCKDRAIPALHWPAKLLKTPSENLWAVVEEGDARHQNPLCRGAEGHYGSNLDLLLQTGSLRARLLIMRKQAPTK